MDGLDVVKCTYKVSVVRLGKGVSNLNIGNVVGRFRFCVLLPRIDGALLMHDHDTAGHTNRGSNVQDGVWSCTSMDREDGVWRTVCTSTECGWQCGR